jgi:hypothetical protein
VCIILYDNKSGHFNCFQLSVLLVVSYADANAFQMKIHLPFGDFSLESLLSKTPSVAELWEPNASISIDPSDHHLIK